MLHRPIITQPDRRRERMLASMLLLFWLVLAGRIVQLHLSSGDDFERLASRQRVIDETVCARPGEIVDRYGNIFATSVTTRSLYVVPAEIQQARDVAYSLGQALGLDAARLFERIARHPDRRFLWIKRRISDKETQRVRELQLPRQAWGFREEFRRLYPQGRAAAQVIGLRDIDGVGRGGVEESLDAQLRGSNGRRQLVQDARGRVIEVRPLLANPVQHGSTIRLTLDAVIQVFAEQALDQVVEQWRPRSACAVVLDPKTGDVLAMASRPTFDPNQANSAAADAWKNRAIADIYEPGSTFKPFVVAWGVHRGSLSRDDEFDCEHGVYRMGRRVLHDHHPYGRLNVTDILVKSSNIGMAKIGQRMGNAKLREAAIVFGFGARTGVELPGELPGMVRPLRQWNSYSTGSVPMGQEIATTPLQLISAYGALANGGRLISPHIVGPTVQPQSAVRLPSNSTTPQPDLVSLPVNFIGNRSEAHISDDAPCATAALVSSQPVEPEIADWICREPLAAVVARGTGKKAALYGYSVFGKTGTAQKPDPATGLYSRDLHVSSFICGAPAESPRALVLISVDEPSVAHNGEHFGGSVAAPAAGELLRKTLLRLKVPPTALPQTAERAGMNLMHDIE